MYPAPHTAPSVPWILTQVAANCGVSDSQQLPDTLLHLLTHEPHRTTGLPCPPTLPLPTHQLSHHPNFEQQLCSGVPVTGLISLENSAYCDSTNFGVYSTSGGGSAANTFSKIVGVSDLGGIHLVRKQRECPAIGECSSREVLNSDPPASSKILCSNQSISPVGLNNRTFWFGAPTRMVSPPSGQLAITVTRGDKNNNNHSTKGKPFYKNNTSHHTNNNNNKNKSTSLRRPPEPDGGTDSSNDKQHSKYDVQVSLSAGQDDESRFTRPKQPPPSKAVDAKEVEKLLQNALWQGSQHPEKKSVEGVEVASSGGCDTGYSSRCSTPPGPLCLPADSLPDASHPKQGNDSTWECRSRSPSSYSISSQGSCRNPRQKRRHNNNNSTANSNNNNSADHHDFHNNRQHHYHHPSHQIRAPHNNHYHYYHHQNYHNQANGGGYAGGNHYYGHHYPSNFVVRDCPPYQNRRYERGYNGYGHYNNHHYGRDYNYHNLGGEPHLGRYNQGRGYHDRYHNNHRNHNYTQRNETTRDQNGIVNDRAGTFVGGEQAVGDPRWRCEVVDTPSQLQTGCEWDSLSQQVWDTFKRHQQTNKTFGQKLRLKEKILRAIRGVIPHCRLYVVGSSLSGFGADWSDVDMCLMVAGRDLDQRTEATAVLRVLQRELFKCSFIEKMELIRAKVPILKFRDAQSQVDVDLNCNNAVGIRNTHLLNSYSQLDWRVRPLVLVVKLWAQHHNINNAKDMTISSYSLVLMVLHYLQQGVEPPVLPCLQKLFPEKFRSHGPVTSITVTEKMPAFTSKNQDSLGKLFHGFLDHFANKFTFIEETISVRTGGTVPTAHCRSVPSSKNDSRMWKYLCIEEPFDLTNTARSVYDEAVFKRVRKVFSDSYKLLDEKRDLYAILGENKL